MQLAIHLLLSTSAGASTLVPITESTCDLATVGVTDPEGVVINGAGELAVVDRTGQVVRRLDGNCAGIGAFSTLGAGAQSPRGIAWDSIDLRYAIADDRIGEVIFVDAAGGAVGSCTTWQVITGLSAIVHDPVADTFLISDTSGATYVMDDSEDAGGACNIVTPLPLPFAATPRDFAYLPDRDRFTVADSNHQEVYVFDRLGNLDDTLRLDNNDTVQGVAYDAASERFLIIDTNQLARVDARGTSELRCALTDNPVGITVRGGQFAMSDIARDRVRIFRASDCYELRFFRTADSPSGIAYLPATDELAVAERTDGRVTFYDYATGADQGSCDTDALGITSPSGVTFLEGLGVFAVADEASSSMVLMDRSCTVSHGRTSTLGSSDASRSAVHGVAFHEPTGTFVTIDPLRYEMMLTTFEGRPLATIPFLFVGLTSLDGITTGASSDTLLVLNSGDLYEVRLPRLAEASELSGRFTSASATGWFVERGGGRFTANIQVGGDTVPAFGQFEAGTGTMVFGGIAPSGKRISVELTVSPDLNTIAFPAPVGTMTRDL